MNLRIGERTKIFLGIFATLGIVSLQFVPDSFWKHPGIIGGIAECIGGAIMAGFLLYLVYKIVGDIRDYLLRH